MRPRNSVRSLVTGWLERVKESKLIREGGWSLGGQIAKAAVTVVSLRLVTEILPTGTYGEATLLLAVLALTHGVASKPLLAAQLRLHPDYRNGAGTSELTAALWPLLLGSAAIGTFVAIALLLVRWGYGALAVGSLAALAWLLGRTGLDYAANYFNAEKHQREVALLGATTAGMAPVAGIGSVLLIEESFLGYVGGRAGALIFLAAAASDWLLWRCGSGKVPDVWRRDEPDVEAEDGADLKAIRSRVISYARPLMPIALLTWGIHTADRYILDYYHTAGDVGIYSATYGLASKPFLILGSAASLTFRPYLFDAFSGLTEGVSSLREAIQPLYRWLLVVVLVGFAGLMLITILRRPLVEVVLAADYRGGVSVVPLLGFGYFLLIVAHVFENWLLAAERTRAILWSVSCAFTASIGAAFYLIPTQRLRGAAIATVIGMGVYLISTFLLALRTRKNL